MRALNHKLSRDLWRMRGQVLAIALVMASGIGVLVMSLTTVESLQSTMLEYYDRHAFADVFAHVERAPDRLGERLRSIPGVRVVETRVVRVATLDVAGFEEPVVGQLVSIPERGEPLLNRYALREGRSPRGGAPDEVMVNEPFAQAHGLRVGDELRAILNGRWRVLRVVGIALSPEYVYAIGPGALMPDDRRYGVLWVGREALGAAYGLEGAFNDVSLSLQAGADTEGVIRRVDALLAAYGGTGAYARADQLSNWFLAGEIRQHRTLATVLPAIFLAVAAFLLHTVMARLIAVERGEIGLLKAFGYSNRDIAGHYLRFVLAIGSVGVVLGWLAGGCLGLYHTRLYSDFYHFPFLRFAPSAGSFVLAAVISLGAATAGTLGAVRSAAKLPPAEAMQPPAPPSFRHSSLGRLSVVRWLDQPSRMMLRQVARWPFRAAVTVFGIAMAVAVMVTSMQWLDAINRIVDVCFIEAQEQDLSVGFAEPRTVEVVRELARLPGVLTAEPMRVAGARLRSAGHEVREAIQGLPARQVLFHAYDAQGRSLDLPPGGLVISTKLAEMLDVHVGDTVTVEVLEGRRSRVEARIVDTFETYIGSPAYMEIGALGRVLREPPSVTAVHLRVDPAHQAALFRELKSIPRVTSVTVRAAAVETFRGTLARTLTIFLGFFAGFSCVLAFGVTYNAARISLSERGRELATLRVLGFTRAEISYLLLGEIAVLTLVAFPLGCAAGRAIAATFARAFETELYRVPLVILPATYGWAIVVVAAATVVSALLVGRRIDRLDLVAVLKARE
jgi:putative ABC transport system permease protein